MRRAELGAAIARIEQQLANHTDILVDVQRNAKATNGRVTKLERAWWYARGVIATVTASVGILAATGHLHLH